MGKTAIQIRESDQVATATTDLFPDDVVEISGVRTGLTIQVKERIPTGHKVALTTIRENEEIRKYGEVIGIATREILPGHWVHIHNCRGIKARRFADSPSQKRGE